MAIFNDNKWWKNMVIFERLDMFVFISSNLYQIDSKIQP